MLTLRLYGDRVLRRKTLPIKQVDDTIRDLVKDMAEVLDAERGIGLAANQVGKSVALLVIDPAAIDEEGDSLPLLNPKITSRSGTITDEEGCLSFPGLRLPIQRAMEIRVDAEDLSGNPIVLEARGMLARVLQHEIDHLNGILFVDRLPLLKRIGMFFKLQKLKRRYRKRTPA